ncbi:MAG: NAD(P)-dependent glycerol-3-phosphate dehydrogenase [Geminicoccaceae bacterium]|nr:NAD(P)-dependent glycerol-3-phosphate dehydrogenase [Geminicoccaceae bacterium]
MNIGIVGAGSWGTALALAMLRAGHRPVLWGRDPEAMARLSRERTYVSRLQGIVLPEEIEVTSELRSLGAMPLLLSAVPVQAMRGVLEPLRSVDATLLVCAKGIERQSCARVTEIVRVCCPHADAGVLSGPSFAREVALGRPTALVCGLNALDRARDLASALSSPTFRLYPSDDVTGIEIGGAFKNVVAIAAGAVSGLGLGENARAAVVTRGLAEIGRMAAALGGRPETIGGLAGLGDLVLSATSATSRNMAFGRELAGGAAADSFRAAGHRLAEGAWTAQAALDLAARHEVELPITQAVADVIEGRTSLTQAIERLLARPLRSGE